MNNNLHDDYFYMSKVLKLAKKAEACDDVPIACIIVYNKNIKNKKMYDLVSNAYIDKFKDKTQIILSKSYNKRNKTKDATAHAEIIAIKKACKKIKDYRLEDCTMYVNLEPCQMCAGAIVQSRIKKLVIACRSDKSGSCGSIINVLDNDNFNHKVDIVYGVMEEESKNIISNYFKEIRKRK